MAVFAIGDVQGCLDDLLRLLDRLNFEPEEDQLWFTGDLVNRGPKSADTVRFVRGLGGNVVSVLGNHDLHLLAVAEGFQPVRREDALQDILEAPDRDELLHWLRHRPLAHYDADLGYLLVHAGLPPQWDLKAALALAGEVETELRGPDYRTLLKEMYGNEPACWDPSLSGMPRWRFIINAFTRLRFCTADGKLDFAHKGPPGSQPDELVPWFRAPSRNSENTGILFGHWSTLSLGAEEAAARNAWALDTGCLWGGKLTALRLDGEESLWTSIDCRGEARPGN